MAVHRGVVCLSRMVGLVWLVGATVLGVVVLLDVRFAREHWLELAVLIWLAPLALYDLRRKEVPHMACVAVPCLAAASHALAEGAWQLSVAAALVIAASERGLVRNVRMRRWLLSLALTIVCLLIMASGEAAPGAIGVLGFWLAFEIGWWAGADAIAAITLALLWPDLWLLVMLAAAHLGVVLMLWLARKLRPASESGEDGHGSRHLQRKAGHATAQPGLPVIALAVILLFLAKLIVQLPL